MIRKFINKLLGNAPSGPSFGKRVEIAASEHGIDPKLVDQRAIDVVHTLQRAGFEAYIVGGAVRDLLLGLRPKDFDVATNATPEQVKGLFRRAFIIGRRFRIVHVVYGRGREHEVIEVSTFRAYLDNAAAEQVAGNEKTSKSELAGMKHAVDSSGRVLRDNVWGPQDEDATRRDFTVNAMYYDPERQIVVDYHKGIADAKKKTLRMIGDPTTRYREDPVRIIRAVRFSAKLAASGFKLDAKTAQPLTEMKALLADIPQSRLFDEMLKLLQTGHALASIEQLKKLGLAKGIYPLLDVVVERAGEPLLKAALQDTDARIKEGRGVSASYLLACALWPDVREGWEKRLARNEHPFPALQDAIDDVFNRRIGDVSGRGKLAADMRDIWQMQPRFEKRSGSSPFTLVEHLRFRAGYDFLCLRAGAGEVADELADWWEEFQHTDDNARADLIAQLRKQQGKPHAARVRRVQPAQHDAQQARNAPELPPDASIASPADDAPAKKRRRRRKPKAPGDNAVANNGD
jgi:poly(A) polymerase